MMTRILTLKGPAGRISVHVDGDERGPAVLLSHSILASHAMWEAQAQLLAQNGWYVLRMDTRGHGQSDVPSPPYEMRDLVDDVVSVLDQLDLDTAHFVGLSLGGMIGFGLGIHYPHRLASLMICDARADAPPPFVAPWEERIAISQQQGCSALAVSTTERWFSPEFLEGEPSVAQKMRAMVSATPASGFVGCARAIQKLDYLDRLSSIETPTTLVVGKNDGPLPEAMLEISALIGGSVYEVIPKAGHLPNVDNPVAFNDALLRHLRRAAK